MNNFNLSILVSEGLNRYYAEANLDAKLTYEEKWAKIKVGPFNFYIPNTEQRKKALRIHDIHHVVTGFKTTLQGEGQISGWEIGSGGCGSNLYVWIIVLTGFFSGLFICPIKTIKAFLMGTKCKNLFGLDPTPYYSLSIRDARKQLNLPV